MKQKRTVNSLLSLLLLVAAVLLWQGFGPQEGPADPPREVVPAAALASGSSAVEADTLDEQGHYTTRDDVAQYLHVYGRLPENFITKREAEAMGWDSKAGNLHEVTGGKSIGGDRFGNYDGLLPDAPGRHWKECDIDYHGGHRGAKRVVYSSDGLIYYTGNHYKSFEQLY